ncbi:L domain-like protein [Rhizoclosmatium globosum]|uniref:L domain-like protein n=1 Tax=Rhizoclosmatium globosum TaxID=329046 RepID=A0A1Y2CXK1_9FUNG|nr:L domain-like protein [Rhizoclosmatium globosum]|eukprot:ORY51065.1 L domain-like protein [Rhizoclosmatium globosum]
MPTTHPNQPTLSTLPIDVLLQILRWIHPLTVFRYTRLSHLFHTLIHPSPSHPSKHTSPHSHPTNPYSHLHPRSTDSSSTHITRFPNPRTAMDDGVCEPGGIPAALGYCESLTVLSMYNTDRIGSIPRELGNLLMLQSLILRKNGLSGVIPGELGNLFAGLGKLRELNISRTAVSGGIPLEWGGLVNLEVLVLSHNLNLSGTIPVEIGGMVSLQRLDLSNCNLGGSIPEEICKNLGLFVSR